MECDFEGVVRLLDMVVEIPVDSGHMAKHCSVVVHLKLVI